ncbi:HFB protein [Trichoderma parareesei]|uniref:HFB protein n=1 Tax=Trichoderma parareesei TaxID=858221 RepID=A0A2H2ZSR9_TRIPA|nr:HFB protein [Trichoderma parareesei]
MRSSAVLLAVAAALVSAQVPTYKSSLNMTIDPNTVAQQQRGKNTLSLSGSATLKYDCTCASNSSAPGLQYYTQTLPTFICEQLYANCIQTNAGNQDGQRACKNNIQKLCATQNPPTAAEISSAEDQSTAAATATTKAASTHHAATTTGAQTASSAAQSTTSSGFAAATLGPAGSGAFAIAAGIMAYML